MNPTTAAVSAAAPEPAAAVRALSWSLGVRLLTLLVGTGSTVVVARVVTPETFGVYAIATLAIAFSLALNDVGVAQAISRWPGDVTRLARTATTIAATSSVVLFTAAYAAAPGFAEHMGAPAATGPVRLVCVGILLDGVIAVPAALMNRQLMQRQRAKIDAASFFIGTPVALTLVVLGAGAYGLAWGRIAGSVVTVIGVLLAAPARPRPALVAADARVLLRYGLPVMASGVTALAVANLDSLAVGQGLGPTALGFYVLAFNLASLATNIVLDAVQGVALPVFGMRSARLEEAQDLLRRSLGWLMYGMGAVCVVTVIAAEPIVAILYGEKWLPAVPVVRLLAVYSLLRVHAAYLHDVLVALGRPGRALLQQIAWLAVLAPALAVAVLPRELRLVAVAQVGVVALVVVPLTLVLLSRSGLASASLAAGVARPAAVTLTTAAAGAFAAAHAPGGRVGVLLIAAACAVVHLAGALPRRERLHTVSLVRRRLSGRATRG